MRRTGPLALAAALLVLGMRPAAAHPHVFIDYTVEPLVEGGAFTAVRLHWTFDEMYSEMVIDSADKDRNRVLSPAEMKEVEGRVVPGLKEQNYFTVLKVDGKPVKPRALERFVASIDRDRVTYAFTLRLPAPAREIAVSSYDAEYYIDMQVSRQEPFRIAAGAAKASCTRGVGEAVKTLYYGSFKPDQVSCRIVAGGS